MGIVADILGLLGRPVGAPRPSPVPAKGAKTPAPEQVPLAESEIIAAIDRVQSERAAALDVIESAGERREALLLREDSDAEIADLGKQVDSANLLLERLERVEPDLRNKLLDLQDARRVEKWLELRNAYVIAGRAHIAHLRETLPDLSVVAETLNNLYSEFHNADRYLPRYPYIQAAQIDQFEAQLMRFSNLVFDPRPPRPLPAVLKDRMQHPEADLAEMTSVWGSAATMEAQPSVTVKLLAARQAADGTWGKIGDTVALNGEEAARLIAAGCAKIPEEKRC